MGLRRAEFRGQIRRSIKWAHLEKVGKLSSGDQAPSTNRLYFLQVTEKNIKTKTVNLSILNRQQNQRVTNMSYFFQMRPNKMIKLVTAFKKETPQPLFFPELFEKLPIGQ